MSELEKVKKEFESYCCRLHDVHCVKKICKDCAIEFMYDREQKLKCEAVKAVEKLKTEREFLPWYVMEKIDKAIKKIEGL